MVSPRDGENLQAGKPAHEAFWSFTLEPVGYGQSRLIARGLAEPPPSVASRAGGRLVWEPAHFVREQ